MRLDVITIFPEYLEPLRHALLGKAIEDGHLTVGVHDLRQWATDNHRSVDDAPFGGGPGMVMKPEVWGPALDDVATLGDASRGDASRGDASLTSAELTSAAPHVERARHDELHGVAKEAYEEGDADSELPLLIVPTPAGKPFTQADARAWSSEERIVFACGRYEGIDQRVFEDAKRRYRVREVSIGDYVLIGGEVAVLVIAEAVTRLIPGVLGNQKSHQEDSFSDGLLEGPSYTKPRAWRGLEVPEVLTSGNHAAIEAWRREQSLKRTKAVRPELLEAAELSKEDRFILNARRTVTRLNLLVADRDWERVKKQMRKNLKKQGVELIEVNDLVNEAACKPGNMLIDEYMMKNESYPATLTSRFIEVYARTDKDLRDVTKLIVGLFPSSTLWSGTSSQVDS